MSEEAQHLEGKPTEVTETERTAAPSEAEGQVYLSGTTSDLAKEREMAGYELRQQRYVDATGRPILVYKGTVSSAGEYYEVARARASEIYAQGALGSEDEVVVLSIPRKEFERLNVKTKEVLEEAALAQQRTGRDQEEIEQLKTETRAVLAQLRAAWDFELGYRLLEDTRNCRYAYKESGVGEEWDQGVAPRRKRSHTYRRQLKGDLTHEKATTALILDNNEKDGKHLKESVDSKFDVLITRLDSKIAALENRTPSPEKKSLTSLESGLDD
jgi:hypothetical protein